MINYRAIVKTLGGRPYRQKREPKNTALARKLARIYEQEIGAFPGGINNAYISRTNAGHIQRSSGAWSWELDVINSSCGFAQPCGSQYTAVEAASNPTLISWD